VLAGVTPASKLGWLSTGSGVVSASSLVQTEADVAGVLAGGLSATLARTPSVCGADNAQIATTRNSIISRLRLLIHLNYRLASAW